jgi:hypothetical protein
MNKEKARGKYVKMLFSNMFKLLMYIHHIELCTHALHCFNCDHLMHVQ